MQPNDFHVLLFDGLGSSSAIADLAKAVQASARRTPHTLSSKFLQECETIFRTLCNSLNEDETRDLGEAVGLEDAALLSADIDALKSPLIAMTTLYTAQTYTYLATLESPSSPDPHQRHVLGYSFGILPATLATGSQKVSELLVNAVDLFHLAFWLGYHCQVYRISILKRHALHDPMSDKPWSVVIYNTTKLGLELALESWNSTYPTDPVHLTAVTTSSCFTVSGHPHAVERFTLGFIDTNNQQSPRYKLLDIFTLYHTRDLEARHGIRSAVLHDYLHRRRSPKYANGVQCHDKTSLIPRSNDGVLHVQSLLDDILLYPVDFHAACHDLNLALARKSSEEAVTLRVKIFNAGPGTSLSRLLWRSLRDCTTRDSTIRDESHAPFVDLQDLLSPQASVTNLSGSDPIAIVGMALDLPGARDADALWDILLNGRNMISEIPLSRFDSSLYHCSSSSTPSSRTLKALYGNFISSESAKCFDPAFFRISPREAKSMDPQQRLLLRVAWEAMQDAGFTASGRMAESDRETKDKTGCFIGVATGDYVANLRGDIGVHYVTGTLPAFLSGRISYALGLGGPSVVINTACSSGLAAIHQACRSITAGDCEVALAGGVNVIAGPDMFIGLDKAHFLSQSGQCKPFSKDADGYCRAEGCVVFVLKKLSQALHDNDNIHAIIRGSEMNQSAVPDEHSITHPHVATQIRLFESVLKTAGATSSDITVVEAHGTGTQAGDTCEMDSICRVLCRDQSSVGRTEDNSLHVTSIKANIGHSEAASGAASLAKVILMMRYGVIPPQISVLDGLNPKIEKGLEGLCLKIAKDVVQWKRMRKQDGCDARRMAMVNNFGASGNNVAAVIEEPPARMRMDNVYCGHHGEPIDMLLAFSAESEELLFKLRDRYISHIGTLCGDDDSSDPPCWDDLLDLAYTVTARREVRPWRISVAISLPRMKVTSANCRRTIQDAIRNGRPAHVRAPMADGEVLNSPTANRVVFVFSGQGKLQLGMGRSMYKTSALFKKNIDTCHRKLVRWGYPGIHCIIADDIHRTADTSRNYESTLIALHCALFSIQHALVEVLASWNIRPEVVLGHSLGEYAALVTAGVLDFESGLRLVAFRARLISQLRTEDCQSSGMVSISVADKDSMQRIMDTLQEYDTLSVSCYNTVSNVVIGGSLEELCSLEQRLNEHDTQTYKCVKLDVPVAYHTDALAPITKNYKLYAEKFRFAPPQIPVFSNVTGSLVAAGDNSTFGPTYLVQHSLLPVLFHAGIEAVLRGAGKRSDIWLEIGPHPTIKPLFLYRSSDGKPLPPLHSTLHGKQSARIALFTMLSQLYSTNLAVKWRAVYHELCPSVRCTTTPKYPLVETKHWVPYVEDFIPAKSKSDVAPSYSRFTFLASGSWATIPSIESANQDVAKAEFELPIKKLDKWILGHEVLSFALCPASVYHELALATATCMMEHLNLSKPSELLTLTDMQFKQPLVYAFDNPAILRIAITLDLSSSSTSRLGSVTVSSLRGGSDDVVLHCSGYLKSKASKTVASGLHMNRNNLYRRKASLENDREYISETYGAETIYSLIFPRVVQYSELYQIVRSMTISGSGEEAIASVKLPQATDPGQDYISSSFAAHPVFIDALLHVPGFLINRKAPLASKDTNEVYICVEVGTMKLLGEAGNFSPSATYDVHCSTFKTEDGHVMADAWAVESSNGDSAKEEKVVAHAKNMRFTRLRANSLHRLLANTTPTQPKQLIRPTITIPPSTFSINDFFMHPVPDSRNTLRQNTLVPSPATSTDTAVAGASLPPSPSLAPGIEHLLLQLVADICEVSIDFISSETELAALGIDSLMWIELLAQLKTLAPDVKIATATVTPKTVANLVKLVKESMPTMNPLQSPSWLRSQSDHRRDYFSSGVGLALPAKPPRYEIDCPLPPIPETEAAQCLRKIQSCASKTEPLILVHDGSGSASYYSRLSSLSRDVWAIQNPKLFTGEGWEGGIDEMAKFYVDQLSHQIAGLKQCILGGWSFGGVVAFHMAKLLHEVNVDVQGVVLIDSPSPFTDEALPVELIDAVFSPSRKNARAMGRSAVTGLVDLAKIQMKNSSHALVSYNPYDYSIDRTLSVVMIRCSEPVNPHLYCADGKHTWKTVPFLENREDPSNMVAGWESLLGHSVPVIDVSGNHFELFDGMNVHDLSGKLLEALSIIQK